MPSIEQRASKAVEFLLARGTIPILYWLKKDILGVPVERECRNLQKYAVRIRILESQGTDGSWKKKKLEDTTAALRPADQFLDTLRNITKLYDFGCTLDDANVRRSVDYLFSVQAKEGDFRGAGWTEPSAVCHAMALEILCRLGLDSDPHVRKGFRWLVRRQQTDGGWVSAGKPCGLKLPNHANAKNKRTKASARRTNSRPNSSPYVTNVALRALAESPRWQKSREAHRGGQLLLARLFSDKPGERRLSIPDWEDLVYPFWAPNLLNSLDAVSKIGFKNDHDRVRRALDWLMRRQNSAGYWESAQEKASLEDHLWVTLAILRMLRRFDLLDV